MRTNIDGENIYDVGDLFRLYEERGWLKYKKFSFNFAAARGKKGSRDIHEPEFSRIIKEALGKDSPYLADGQIYNNFSRIFEYGGRSDFGAHYCGANTGQLVFDPFGDIHACWGPPMDERDKIGRYYPEFVFFEDRLSDWRDRTVTKIAACKGCKYALLCKGGCSLHAYDLNGSLLSPFCDGFPEKFESEVKLAYRNYQLKVAESASLAQEYLAEPVLTGF